MKALIIYSHPTGKPFSYNEHILTEVQTILSRKQYEVTIRDLYEMKFDPILSSNDFDLLHQRRTPKDIQTEQDYITEADLLLVISPIWWASFPAILKGYFDRVFAHGFAYQAEADGSVTKKLTGKKGIFINTFGNSTVVYEQSGMIEAFKHTMNQGVFEFTGIEPIGYFSFGETNARSEKTVAKIISKLEEKLPEMLK
ncbi:NAD(P)H-dependent oxidoreductase [Enterococcus xiangfangensis]|uniref:NAD(P)H-dependent oxidoreductase n=1 Tax=Enterococcus xiangfangensis TaxID=1296537 RepID=UPI0010F6416E|nr:NAD(P)H-dependent oxidoreductase [Enterococcus xiangfangensis]MBM7711229.1 NAD(P)H dehydrogenase (quinone) [Enterococcus xiangfangensis]NBK07941.1 flavodoxin family protein [Enterococcus asini]